LNPGTLGTLENAIMAPVPNPEVKNEERSDAIIVTDLAILGVTALLN
jgi:hypothetical protein